jgi:hypothetical protein
LLTMAAKKSDLTIRLTISFSMESSAREFQGHHT